MSIADTTFYQNRIQEISFQLTQDMIELHREEPEMFEGRSTLEEWANQVWKAKIDLDERIAKQVEEVEALLHDGQYTAKLY